MAWRSQLSDTGITVGKTKPRNCTCLVVIVCLGISFTLFLGKGIETDAVSISYEKIQCRRPEPAPALLVPSLVFSFSDVSQWWAQHGHARVIDMKASKSIDNVLYSLGCLERTFGRENDALLPLARRQSPHPDHSYGKCTGTESPQRTPHQRTRQILSSKGEAFLLMCDLGICRSDVLLHSARTATVREIVFKEGKDCC